MEEAVMGRLHDVVNGLEATLARMEERDHRLVAETEAERIVATAVSAREEELERKLAEAEEKLTRLEAAGASGRKTLSAGRMSAKEDVDSALRGALDGALQSLSVEQRIAVKAELMRAGAL